MGRTTARETKPKATKRLSVSESLAKLTTSSRRNANKIADICNDIIARVDENSDVVIEAGREPIIRPTFDELVESIRAIEKIATKMRADTGTTDETYKKKHR